MCSDIRGMTHAEDRSVLTTQLQEMDIPEGKFSSSSGDNGQEDIPANELGCNEQLDGAYDSSSSSSDSDNNRDKSEKFVPDIEIFSDEQTFSELNYAKQKPDDDSDIFGEISSTSEEELATASAEEGEISSTEYEAETNIDKSEVHASIGNFDRKSPALSDNGEARSPGEICEGECSASTDDDAAHSYVAKSSTAVRAPKAGLPDFDVQRVVTSTDAKERRLKDSHSPRRKDSHEKNRPEKRRDGDKRERMRERHERRRRDGKDTRRDGESSAHRQRQPDTSHRLRERRSSRERRDRETRRKHERSERSKSVDRHLDRKGSSSGATGERRRSPIVRKRGSRAGKLARVKLEKFRLRERDSLHSPNVEKLRHSQGSGLEEKYIAKDRRERRGSDAAPDIVADGKKPLEKTKVGKPPDSSLRTNRRNTRSESPEKKKDPKTDVKTSETLPSTCRQTDTDSFVALDRSTGQQQKPAKVSSGKETHTGTKLRDEKQSNRSRPRSQRSASCERGAGAGDKSRRERSHRRRSHDRQHQRPHNKDEGVKDVFGRLRSKASSRHEESPRAADRVRGGRRRKSEQHGFKFGERSESSRRSEDEENLNPTSVFAFGKESEKTPVGKTTDFVYLPEETRDSLQDASLLVLDEVVGDTMSPCSTATSQQVSTQNTEFESPGFKNAVQQADTFLTRFQSELEHSESSAAAQKTREVSEKTRSAPVERSSISEDNVLQRHINQLFIRGDNVVMVALIT